MFTTKLINAVKEGNVTTVRLILSNFKFSPQNHHSSDKPSTVIALSQLQTASQAQAPISNEKVTGLEGMSVSTAMEMLDNQESKDSKKASAANPMLDAVDNDGRSPLMYAALSKNTEMVALLVEAGADVLLVDKQGKNAFVLVHDAYLDLIKNTSTQELVRNLIKDATSEETFHLAILQQLLSYMTVPQAQLMLIQSCHAARSVFVGQALSSYETFAEALFKIVIRHDNEQKKFGSNQRIHLKKLDSINDRILARRFITRFNNNNTLIDLSIDCELFFPVLKHSPLEDEMIACLTNVTQLSLLNLRPYPKFIHQVCQRIKDSKLEKLLLADDSLRSKKDTAIRAWVATLTPAIRQTKNLLSLSLRTLYLNSLADYFDPLIAALGMNSSIESLSLISKGTFCLPISEWNENIDQMLRTNASIRSLSLGGWYLDPSLFLQSLKTSLIARPFPLCSLNLSEISMEEKDYQLLVKNIGELNQLQEIDIPRCRESMRNQLIREFYNVLENHHALIRIGGLEDSLLTKMLNLNFLCGNPNATHWGKIAIVIAFVRANQANHFKYSVIALIPQIMNFMKRVPSVIELMKAMMPDSIQNHLLIQAPEKVSAKRAMVELKATSSYTLTMFCDTVMDFLFSEKPYARFSVFETQDSNYMTSILIRRPKAIQAQFISETGISTSSFLQLSMRMHSLLFQGIKNDLPNMQYHCVNHGALTRALDFKQDLQDLEHSIKPLDNKLPLSEAIKTNVLLRFFSVCKEIEQQKALDKRAMQKFLAEFSSPEREIFNKLITYFTKNFEEESAIMMSLGELANFLLNSADSQILKSFSMDRVFWNNFKKKFSSVETVLLPLISYTSDKARNPIKEFLLSPKIIFLICRNKQSSIHLKNLFVTLKQRKVKLDLDSIKYCLSFPDYAECVSDFIMALPPMQLTFGVVQDMFQYQKNLTKTKKIIECHLKTSRNKLNNPALQSFIRTADEAPHLNHSFGDSKHTLLGGSSRLLAAPRINTSVTAATATARPPLDRKNI